MARIYFRHPHSNDTGKIKSKLRSVTEEAARRYGLTCKWVGDNCMVSGPATGHIRIHHEHVEIHMKLGFTASLFKKTIERELKNELQRILPEKA